MNDERLNRVHGWAAGDLDRGVVVVVVDACFTDAATAAWLRQRNAATGGSGGSSLTYTSEFLNIQLKSGGRYFIASRSAEWNSPEASALPLGRRGCIS